MTARLPGRATPEGTARFAARHPDAAFRTALDLHVSTLGWGSYLDASPEAALASLDGGVNVLDTARTYRGGASEADLGEALGRFVAAGGARDEVVVSTKAGYGADPAWPESVDGHCLHPDFLETCLEASLDALGVETVDVFYLHNPEHQLAHGVPEPLLLERLRAAFAFLETAADAGRIAVYGVATWNGLRVPPGHPEHLPLTKLVHEAGRAAMDLGRRAAAHRFRALQLPVNLLMTEAALVPSQPWKFGLHTALQAASDLGVLVHASAAQAQGHVRGRVAPEWKEALGTDDDLEAAQRFARSVPGVHAALVGTGDPWHAAQNAAWAKAWKPDPATVGLMLGPGGPHG